MLFHGAIMKDKFKLAFLVPMLIVSTVFFVPIATIFFVNYYSDLTRSFLTWLIGGASLRISIAQDSLIITPYHSLEFFSFQLSILAIVAASTVVFCICLALTVRTLHQMLKPTATERKRPFGIKLIAATWFFAGLILIFFTILYMGNFLSLFLSDLDPTNTIYVDPWLKSVGIPALVLIHSTFLFSGLLQLVTAFELWTERARSYKLAIMTFTAQFVACALFIGIFVFAPTWMWNWNQAALRISGLIWCTIWMAFIISRKKKLTHLG